MWTTKSVLEHHRFHPSDVNLQKRAPNYSNVPLGTLRNWTSHAHADVEPGDKNYVELLMDMGCGPDCVMKLKEGLSGVGEAPRLWKNKKRIALDFLEFERCPTDPSVYRHCGDMDLTVHVDGITLTGDYDVVLQTVEALKLELQVKTIGETKKTGDQTNLMEKTMNENDNKMQVDHRSTECKHSH